MWSQMVTASELQDAMQSRSLTTSQNRLNAIYDAMENLLDEKVAPRKWNESSRIGFKIG